MQNVQQLSNKENFDIEELSPSGPQSPIRNKIQSNPNTDRNDAINQGLSSVPHLPSIKRIRSRINNENEEIPLPDISVFTGSIPVINSKNEKVGSKNSNHSKNKKETIESSKKEKRKVNLPTMSTLSAKQIIIDQNSTYSTKTSMNRQYILLNGNGKVNVNGKDYSFSTHCHDQCTRIYVKMDEQCLISNTSPKTPLVILEVVFGQNIYV